MNQPEDKDLVDTQLREQNTYINDDGFTARVVAALPRRRRLAWFRTVLLLGTAAAGWVLAILWLPWEHLPRVDLSALLSWNSQVLTPWILVLTVVASLIWAVVAAVQWDD
ncbi:MAG TPA: hypothetical protein VL171_07710 [Verrucomicrobiae bacterium]|nr:hypothetical protein [Verrucomicrobiae bacterium]